MHINSRSDNACTSNASGLLTTLAWMIVSTRTRTGMRAHPSMHTLCGLGNMLHPACDIACGGATLSHRPSRHAQPNDQTVCCTSLP